MLIAIFVYNNTKNASIKHIFFKYNCKYHFYVLFKKDTNLYSKFKLVDKLDNKLKTL